MEQVYITMLQQPLNNANYYAYISNLADLLQNNNMSNHDKHLFVERTLLCLQSQIDNFVLKYNTAINTNYFSEIITNLKNVYFTLFGSMLSNIKQEICERTLTFTDTSTTITYNINKDIRVIYITIIGGGGAGGIGYVRDPYCYTGSGGGGAACFIKKPFLVTKGTSLQIKVGKGGQSNTSVNGENSSVAITTAGETLVITANGGLNGKPSLYDIEHNVTYAEIHGGSGGSNTCIPYLCGTTGCPGTIALPNTTLLTAGNGGASYFSCGGKAGALKQELYGEMDIKPADAEPGTYGSGGGGSIPVVHLDTTKPLSGNGGNGIVILEL
jgi:hypothetical protein